MKNNQYWVVAYTTNPLFKYRETRKGSYGIVDDYVPEYQHSYENLAHKNDILVSKYKPHFLKSVGHWEINNHDYVLVDVKVLNMLGTTKTLSDFSELQKMNISLNINN